VRIERTRPEYVVLCLLAVRMTEVARLSRPCWARRSRAFDPESQRPLPPRLASVRHQSMIVTAFIQVGKPYMFELHQCSHPRSDCAEERLFHEIGRRLADALNTC